ncbi:immunoglobulin superfamily DCC subclass member 3 [Nematolebias whitei]|uniref:immunoglobulin superfamily DCC subclass member 3 n=1 Tax=Nematolebias whitei TaxID=451745 RepID=UPI00189BD6AA|nr:immunoglobulin superfamily DCC subclass member 3 [Nematolebias whitei]
MKCFEWLVMTHMKDSIDVTVDPHQYAYRRNRSTADAITSTLVQKLFFLGLSPTLGNWIVEFLTNRPQTVRIHIIISSSIILSSGSPQGCVLSTLLFTLLTYDCLARHPSCNIVTFVDDTAVVGRIMNSDESKYRYNVTLTIHSISQEDEAIYQCIAENRAGSTQASARLTVLWSDGLPGVPTHVQAEALSPTTIQVSWREPQQNTQDIIGYVLHIRRTSDPLDMEYEEAVSKVTLQQVIRDLEPSTSYTFYVKAYTSHGASKPSDSITESTHGEVPAAPSLFTKVMNSSVVQVMWESSTKMGQHQGFKLYYRRAQAPLFSGPFTFAPNITQWTITLLDSSVVYEIKLLAYNQHGDGNATTRFVSLQEALEKSVLDGSCDCVKDEQSKTSTTGIIIGIHIGVTCIIFCVLFLVFSYRGRLMMCKTVQATPQAAHSAALESSSSSQGSSGLNGTARREIEVNGSAAGKKVVDSNELERLFTQRNTQNTSTSDSYILNDTQLSTIPLDEFSDERETPFQEPPSARAAQQDQG